MARVNVLKKGSVMLFSLFVVIGSCGSDSANFDPPITEDDPIEKETVEEVKVIDVTQADSNLPTFVSFEDTTPEGMVWEKVVELSDEFDTWNDAKWQKTNWNYGGTPVNMVNTNSGVADGNLWIKATLDDSSEEQWFKTSRIRSKAKIKFPMYTECSIKTAHISAFNTFWLNNGDSNNRDEIDIIENNSKPTLSPTTSFALDEYPWQMNSQYFIVKNGETERAKGNSSNKNLSEGNTLKGVKWNEAYHVVGAWWKDAYNVQFYLDGEPSGNITTTQPFTLEQFLIWDLWTQDSPWVGGLPEKEELLDDSINTMRVDWVRTWKLKSK
ncbi:family 16 glycosylhydrolase [Wenyingzhuangia sp. 2_MG-2023]|uniref:family 16 glycosylhydrolase n=1 Tax=Wenyingzhuangia sp. 2_MG-2023 TaxID=3062639 RepID=UPI0026E14710|nr:family 16 glycosylhydrolase [Wenyingzhuangia sp. 2_MG-2023]MDO6736474.1 family 16 glycosylhydrolase [Wenyingzhuangia sp. 2_MG-2023]